MDLHPLVINGLVMFVLLFLIGGFITGVNSSYGLPGSPLPALANVTEVEKLANDLGGQFSNSKLSFTDVPYILGTTAYTAFKLIFVSLPNMWNTFLSQVVEALHLPNPGNILVGACNAAILLTIVFAVWKSFTRVNL
jgi:hypothetical protein